MHRILSELGVQFPQLIAGLFGGLISLSVVKAKSKAHAAFLVLTGSIVAAYMTPAIAEYFKLSIEFQNGLSFLLGLGSMAIIKGMMTIMDIVIIKVTKKVSDETI